MADAGPEPHLSGENVLPIPLGRELRRALSLFFAKTVLQAVFSGDDQEC